MIQNLTVGELFELLESQPDWVAGWQVVDVREPWELERASIRHPQFRHSPIPMATVPLRLSEIDPGKKVLVMCRSGGRSMQVAAFLDQNGYPTVYNLQGGITAWSREIDPSVPTY